MSNLNIFLKKNQLQRENAFYAATKSLLDENGQPALWEIRALSTAEDERLKEECIKEVAVVGKQGSSRTQFDITRYLLMQVVAAVVSPNLYSAELQDSYGVKTPEDLLKEMVYDRAEFAALGDFVRDFSGFDSTLSEEVEEAKN